MLKVFYKLKKLKMVRIFEEVLVLDQHNYAKIKLMLKNTGKNARCFNKIITAKVIMVMV